MKQTQIAVVVLCVLVAQVLAAGIDPHPHDPLPDHKLKFKSVAPSVRFSVSGTIAVVPDVLYVYLDGSLYDHKTPTLTVTNTATSRSVDCSTLLARYFEYSSVAFPSCFAPVRQSTPATYVLTATITSLATGRSQVFTASFTLIENSKYPWPLENDGKGWPPTEPNLAGNIMENYQSYSGDASAYWHQGLDIRGNSLQEVHSPVAGEVVQRVRYSSSDAYWSLMVRDDQGFVWQFHHMDPDTIRYNIGDRVQQGDVLGQLIFWTAQHLGVFYHHTHMNIALPKPEWTSIPLPYVDGWQYFNPFNFLQTGNYTNLNPPQSNGILYFLPDNSNTAFASSADATEPVLSGAVDIVVQLSSEFTPTNSLARQVPYVNGVYEVGFSVTPLNDPNPDHAIPVLPLIRMDKLPDEWSSTLPDLGAEDVDALLRHVYRQSFTYRGKTFRSVYDYNQRVLYYTVTHAVRGEPDPTGAWRTNQVLPDGSARFPNGRYVIKVYATDVYGLRLEIEKTVTLSN